MMVLKKSKELITYKNGATEMTYFNVICAKEGEILHIRIYQRQKFTMVRTGVCYKFANLVKRGDACWCVSNSAISYAAPVNCEVFPENKLILPEEEPKAGSKRSIRHALESPQKSTVVGKIMKVSPLQFRQEGSLAVRSLAIKDRSETPVKVTLFDKLATDDYLPDAVVEISGVYQKTYQNRAQLTASRDTEYQFVANSDVQDIVCSEADMRLFADDPDFQGNDENCSKTTLSVDSIYEVAIYDGCVNNACRRKKIQDNKCPICGRTASEKTIRLKVEVMEENVGRHFTLFQRDAESIFDFHLSEDSTEENMILNLVSQLPIGIKAKVIRNTMLDIEKI